MTPRARTRPRTQTQATQTQVQEPELFKKVPQWLLYLRYAGCIAVVLSFLVKVYQVIKA